MGCVVHFEIHADKPERAVKFYQPVFNWEFSKWGEVEYWLVYCTDSEGNIFGMIQNDPEAK